MAIEVSVGHAQAFALHPFEGVGAQFNVNVFTPDGQPRPLTQPQHDALRTSIQNLKPGRSSTAAPPTQGESHRTDSGCDQLIGTG